MAKILIIDDNEDIRFLCSHELGKEGHEIIQAANGEQALDCLQIGYPDLIIMDIQMPGKDGLTTMGYILKDNRIPIILYTAFGEYSCDFRSWGAEEFVVKSHDFKPLKKAVTRVLTRHVA